MAEADTARGGMGCFAKGCLFTSVAAFILATILFGGAWLLYKKAVDRYTSSQPMELTIAAPTAAQSDAANEMLTRLRTSAKSNKPDTIEFSATDLNALIAQDADAVANPRRKIRIGMANSIMTLEMSVPFDHPRLPGLKGRWFNCTARFGLEYVYGQFRISPKSVIMNGYAAPQIIFSENFVSSFNRSFTKSFIDSLRRSEEGGAFWGKIKSITVRDDKLVVVTEPGG